MKNIRNIKKQTKHDEIECSEMRANSNYFYVLYAEIPIVISAYKTVIGKGILTFK